MGCNSHWVACYIVDVLPPVGIQERENKQNDIEIYPNPVTDFVYLKSNNKYHKMTVSISDILGRTYINEKEIVLGTKSQQIEIRLLRAGIYVIITTDAEGKVNRFKIVKQ